MHIRQPNDLELRKILSLSPQAIFEGTLGEIKPTNEKIKQLVEPLLEKGCNYFIAIKEDQLMGWILFGSSKDQFTDEPNGFIYEIFVIEEYRGKGISKKLMKAAIDQLRQNGYSEVRLSAFKDNQAIQIYEDMGFSTRTVTMGLSL
ncbi:GNAT family N-acetyltransferase [Oceanobacillus timonensis]|uniref:GNAT family N-acetyltransferase n=1 Tax=Oceanobacillus timonensis TaxID=1926285 RepID=UPI0009BAEAF3|nr:GNAT family N-acetyltransferase [Oceanobacillus timonensis]